MNYQFETKEFDYYLPEEKIAKYPLEKRNQSKLLIYKDGKIKEKIFYQIYEEIPEGYLLIFNNTKVIPARLFFKKATGAVIEIFLLEPFFPKDYSLIFQAKETCQWICYIGNLKRWKNNESLSLEIKLNNDTILLYAKKIDNYKDGYIVEFTWNGNYNFIDLINKTGNIPIPPYLKRNVEKIDYERYQTIFSKIAGSVAAPTASLHFTEQEFKEFDKKNIKYDFLTLHVGAGTFKPITTKYINEHELHTETFKFNKSLLKLILKQYPNIIAVGTTTLRALESIYHVANIFVNTQKIVDEIDQWCEYSSFIKNETIFVLKKLYDYIVKNNIDEVEVKTKLMISPGYKIKMANALITNFHQPKSSLLTLIYTFVEDDWRKIYDYALNNNFRFLSYGDCSLLWKKGYEK
jgi:S-adenosylmethionine:tRNA ribosyltransferase-isomerase